MKKKTIIKIQVVSAITWATALIACSYVIKDFGYNKDIFNILLAGATMNFLLLSQLSTKKNNLIKHCK